MNAKLIVSVVVGVGLALLGAISTHAQEITGFTAIRVVGDCQVIENDQPRPIKEGETFSFGTTVETQRRSVLDLQFSDGNTFRLLARTRLQVSEATDNPKLKVLRLEKGDVELSLDKFPKDHKLQVETPTAVCGAVGTRFVVTFEPEAEDATAKSESRSSGFSCSQGEVYVASRFSIDDKEVIGNTLNVPSMPAGSQLVATIHEGLENSYTDIVVTRGRLSFEYGGSKGNSFAVEPRGEDKPTRFVCALEKSEDSVQMAAVEVREGAIVNTRKRFLLGDETTEITAEDGAVLVKDQKVFAADPEEAEEAEKSLTSRYLAAAQEEGELHSQWIDITLEGRADPLLEARVVEAARNATALRSQLATLRTIRMLNQIKRGASRSMRPMRR